jgi:transcriptional antiterminator RfaH
MNAIKAGWYVIYTKPRHEKKVAKYLQDLEIQNYLPTLKTLKIWTGKKKNVILPLFPSYVFVKLESIKNYFESLHVPGVLNYVRMGNQIAGINETIIQKLQTIILKSSSSGLSVSTEHFSPGCILNIQAGPFSGFSCEVIQCRGRNKMLVRIELLHRNILLDLPAEYLSENVISA